MEFIMEKTIRDIEKGQDLLRVELSEFKGNQYVGARIYYMDDKGDWKPTRKGLTLSPDMMAQVRDAITEALETLEKD
ncbi:MAG: transcriptional regulator [Candidatus Aegiribacteria sp.]|nr:transcriptional regulator [Candidatus Aegiribacteria sp.]MBD3295626.1 transcriptional regulator [Candidatus Fermentibacteria bacterium]